MIPAVTRLPAKCAGNKRPAGKARVSKNVVTRRSLHLLILILFLAKRVIAGKKREESYSKEMNANRAGGGECPLSPHYPQGRMRR